MLKDLFENGKVSVEKLVEYKKHNKIISYGTVNDSYMVDSENIIKHYEEPRQTFNAVKLINCIDGNFNLISSIIINEIYLVSISVHEMTD